MDFEIKRGISEGEKHDPETFTVIGAAMAVHRGLGSGFLEAVYQKALACELTRRKLPFKKEVEIPIFYCGESLELNYRADFICYSRIVVEIKAIEKLTLIEEAQVINYLRATSLNLALLFNFGTPRLQYRRFVLTNNRS